MYVLIMTSRYGYMRNWQNKQMERVLSVTMTNKSEGKMSSKTGHQ